MRRGIKTEASSNTDFPQMQLSMSGPLQSGKMLNSRKRSSFIKSFPNKLPRVEGVVGGTGPMGLPQAVTLSSTFQKVPIKYAESPFSYSFNGKGATDFLPLRRSSKNSLSQIIQPFHVERQLSNETLYRSDKMAFPVEGFQTSVIHSAKSPFKPYKGSLEKSLPSAHGIHSSIALRKLNGGANISPQSRSSLVIPKPVYGHSPCCPKPGYTSTLWYSTDHAIPQINQGILNENWTRQYRSMALLQREVHERLIEEHNHHLERDGDRFPLKDTNPKLQFPTESPEHMRIPTLLQPKFTAPYIHPSHPSSNYSSMQFSNLKAPSNMNQYKPSSLTCSSVATQKGPQSHLGISCKMYQNNHVMLKYTEVPQHTVLCYPENVAAENSSTFKDAGGKCTEENSSNVRKGICRKPTWQHEDLRLPFKDVSVATAPGSHPFLRTFKQSLNGVCKMQSKGGQKIYSSEGVFSEESGSQQYGWGSYWPLDVQKVQDGSLSEQLCRLHSPGAIHSLQSHSDSRCRWNLAQANCSVPVNGRHEDNLRSEETLHRPTSDHHRRKTGHIVEKPQHAEYTPSLSTKLPDYEKPKPSDCITPAANKLSFLGHSEVTDCISVVKTPKQGGPKKDLTEKQKYGLQPSSSPPMPVINNVFSLAPYKSYLESLEKSQKVKAEEMLTTCLLQKEENKSEGVHQCLKETGDTKDDAHGTIDVCIENNKHGVMMHASQIYAKNLDCVGRSFAKPGTEENKFLQHKPSEHSVHILSLNSTSPPLSQAETDFFLEAIQPQCLKLSDFMSDVIKPSEKEVHLSTTHITNGPKQTHDHFMKLHLSLCRRISSSASSTKEPELIAWLAKGEMNKTLSICSLLGSSAREIWLKCQDTAAALRQVICQLENYVSCRQCPFPHVIRAGTIFIPMLVVKEVLFTDVPGELIDQVLQEHRIELRPTTLSEERHLMQLQKRTYSSKQRRLLSLRQLPDIYPDILNLFYFTCVKERLGSPSPDGTQQKAHVSVNLSVGPSVL